MMRSALELSTSIMVLLMHFYLWATDHKSPLWSGAVAFYSWVQFRYDVSFRYSQARVDGGWLRIFDDLLK